MAAAIRPERLVIRRALPFFPALLIVSFFAGLMAAGTGAGASAVIGVLIVLANFVASGLSLAWSSQISPVAIYAVVLGGFLLKLVVLAISLLALRTLGWFSTDAFVAAFVPSMLALLICEMKVLSGPIQADLWYFRDASR